MTMMRDLHPADRDEVLALDHFAFVADPTARSAEHSIEPFDWSRARGAEHPDMPGRLSGLYSSYPLEVRVPGTSADAGGTRPVPVDGLTWVCVHPDARRRGVLRTMMTDFLRRARERGEIIAGLHASEAGIYGRFGYSVASRDVRFELSRGTRLAAPPQVAALADATTTEIVYDVDDDEIAARIHAVETAQRTLGTVAVPPALVRRNLRDDPAARAGREPRRGLVARRDGADVGWAVFSRSVEWHDGNPDGTVTVGHLSALDPGALAALGQRLVDMDLMSRTRFSDRGLDDPLLAWAGSLRARAVRIADALWLRPVDAAGMLAARGYAAPLDLTVELTDETCEWNAGRHRLVVDAGGEATCEATDAEADLRLDVDVLGELYLGLRGGTALAAEGRIQEVTGGSVAALTRAFTTGVAPIGGSSF